MTSDTRKDKRAKIAGLTVRYKSATVDEFLDNQSHDVSVGGVFVKTSAPFAPGTLLKFEIRIAQESSVIAGVGRVVWKREPTQVASDRPAGMGVKFIKIDDAARRTIDRLVTEALSGAAVAAAPQDAPTVAGFLPDLEDSQPAAVVKAVPAPKPVPKALMKSTLPFGDIFDGPMVDPGPTVEPGSKLASTQSMTAEQREALTAMMRAKEAAQASKPDLGSNRSMTPTQGVEIPSFKRDFGADRSMTPTQGVEIPSFKRDFGADRSMTPTEGTQAQAPLPKPDFGGHRSTTPTQMMRVPTDVLRSQTTVGLGVPIIPPPSAMDEAKAPPPFGTVSIGDDDNFDFLANLEQKEPEPALAAPTPPAQAVVAKPVEKAPVNFKATLPLVPLMAPGLDAVAARAAAPAQAAAPAPADAAAGDRTQISLERTQPLHSSQLPDFDSPPPAKRTAGAGAMFPRPAAPVEAPVGGVGMFPSSDKPTEARHTDPKPEPTVMKQAAEFLEEALREAGGSMDEIGQSPLFGNAPPKDPPPLRRARTMPR